MTLCIINLIRSLAIKNLVKLLVILVMFSGCNENVNDLPEYFSFSFTDNINFAATLDTINIILEQRKNHIKVLDSVPHKIINSSSLYDSVKLKLFVSYGGYNIAPEINKQIFTKQDSVFIWYSLQKKVEVVPSKSNSIPKSFTSPRISHTSVDSIEVFKPSSKTVFFKSTCY